MPEPDGGAVKDYAENVKDYAQNTEALRDTLRASTLLNEAEAAGAAPGVLARLALHVALADRHIAALRHRGTS